MVPALDLGATFGTAGLATTSLGAPELELPSEESAGWSRRDRHAPAVTITVITAAQQVPVARKRFTSATYARVPHLATQVFRLRSPRPRARTA